MTDSCVSKDDRLWLDRRIHLIVCGVDVGADAIYAETLGVGFDPERRVPLWFGLSYDVVEGPLGSPDTWATFWHDVVDTREWWIRVPGKRARPVRKRISRGFVDMRYQSSIVHRELASRYWWEREHDWKNFARRGRVGLGGRLHLHSSCFLGLQGGGRRNNNDHPHPLQVRAFGAVGIHGRERHYARRNELPFPVTVDVSEIKDLIFDDLVRDSDATRRVASNVRVNFNAGAAYGYDDAWAQSVTAEYRKPKHTPGRGWHEVWLDRGDGQKKENEAFDCRVYCVAAAMMSVYPSDLAVSLEAAHEDRHAPDWARKYKEGD